MYGIWAYSNTFSSVWAFFWKLGYGSGSGPASGWKVGSGSTSASNKNQDTDTHTDPHQIKISIQIRIRIGIKVINRIRIRIRIKVIHRIRIRIRIKVINRIQIRIRIKVIQTRNTGCNSSYRGVFYGIKDYRTSFLLGLPMLLVFLCNVLIVYSGVLLIYEETIFKLCSHFEFECLQEFEIIYWKCLYFEWE